MNSKAHIYMANMLLREVGETGSVIIIGYGRFAVPGDIASAITHYPKVFRAGAVGPDFFPDMIVGRTVIHPSHSGKWLDRMETELLSMSRTDPDWEEAYAFYLGFLIHYAGDMFVNDYVNGLSGGCVANISRAEKDIDKARLLMRHILTEAYIDKKIPKSEDISLSAPLDFIFRCFANEDAARLYSDIDTNILKYMIDLKSIIHRKAQDKSVSAVCPASGFASWEKDIDGAVMEWLRSWNNIAGSSFEENGISKARDELTDWFVKWRQRLTSLPQWAAGSAEDMEDIADHFNIFKNIAESFTAKFKGILKSLVFAATGITDSDTDKLMGYAQDFFNAPELYLNNGMLFDTRDITERLDKELGNFGTSQNVYDRSFAAFARSLNMCRMTVMGADNLNSLLGKHYGGAPLFREKPLRSGVSRLYITVKTGTEVYSGTNDNIYFAVILSSGKVFEVLMDKPGYDDFEKGSVDTYRFELPETVYYDSIAKLRVRKDNIVNDDWRMKHIKVVDGEDGFCLADKETNVRLRNNSSYELDISRKISVFRLSVNAMVMDHLYSLNGVCPMDKPDYKPWNEPCFFLNVNRSVRKNVLLPLFELEDHEIVPMAFYSVYAAGIGWIKEACSGETAGSVGQSRQLEAVRIRMNGADGNIRYSVYAADRGWLSYVRNGETSGVTGHSCGIEAIKIRLDKMPAYSVIYRVYSTEKGWSEWVCDNSIAGAAGDSAPIEAIEIRLEKR